MKTKTIIIALTLLFLTSLMLSLSYRSAMGAGLPSERFLGYNTAHDKWTTGNLGSAYVEGDWVSYQLRIDTASKVWGATEFSISFNFHQDSSNAIYVDGFDISTATGFQYQIDGSFLPDGQPTPSPAWTHIPTPEAGESWSSGPKITNYMDPWPPGTVEPSDPNSAQVADERYFSVNGLPWGSATDNIILFYRAHLALSIIWSAGLESDLPQVLDGGEFDDWTNMFMGASFATGSSRHFFLQYPGIGGKTIPIPIAQYPSTIINGHKYVNDVLFDGWQITLTGELTLGSGLPPIPYNPPPVLTGTPPWTTGYFEFTGLVTGSYTVDEEEKPGYGHVDIVVSGDATNIVINTAEGWASFDLAQGGTATVDFYNSRPSRTTTLLSSSTITLGQSITDTATVSSIDGSPPIPTGTVTFYVGSSISGPWTQVGTVKTLDSSGNAVSDSYTPLATGTYYFRVVYSGDSNYLPSESDPATEVLVVNKATPTVTTLLSATTITLGESITDTATVTGLGGSFPVPTGTVTFWVSTSVAGPWTQVGVAKPLVGGMVTSDSYTPLSAGTYYFKAVYSGDSNYFGAESDPATEVLVVNKATPIVTTLLSDTTITLGESITDTATVTGLGGSFPMPTGTVTFWVSTSVAGPWTQVGAAKPLVGGFATSDSFTPLATGTYYFKAIYSGDSNYLGAESDPATEVLVVNKATPTVTTLLSAMTITLGQSITDTATVTGLGGSFPMPTGTVTFYVGQSTIGPWTQVGAVKPLVGGVATSDSFTPSAAGTYYFKAVYSGDSNYFGAESDPATEVLVVNKAPTTTVTLLSASTIVFGDSVTDTITISTTATGTLPDATGTWIVEASQDSTFATGVITVDFGSVSGQLPFTVTTVSWVPPSAGTWYFRATYSGDSNYSGSQSNPLAEQLVVTPKEAHTVGYWKNHPEDWVGINPNDLFPWATGSVSGYTYMQILETSPGGDASIILAQQYIAAKLNFYAFGVPSYIATAIADAEAFFAGTSSSPFYPTAYPAGSNPPDDTPGSPRDYAINLASVLEAYNSS